MTGLVRLRVVEIVEPITQREVDELPTEQDSATILQVFREALERCR